MSAVPVIEPVVTTTPRSRRRQVADRPATIIELPIVRSRPAPKTRAKTKSKRSQARATSFAAHAVAFCAVAVLTSATLGLSGQVLVEQARRNNMSASERARVAVRESASLRDDVMTLTSASSIEGWAGVNGFVQAQGSPLPSGQTRAGSLVALKD